MRCAQCQHDNREGAKFCEACGNKLELVCSACGTALRLGATFCDNCGAPLTQKPRGKRRNGETGKRRKEKNVPGLRTADPGRWTPTHLAERILA